MHTIPVVGFFKIADLNFLKPLLTCQWCESPCQSKQCDVYDVPTMCLQHLLVSKTAGLLFLGPLKKQVLFLSVNAQKCKYCIVESIA